MRRPRLIHLFLVIATTTTLFAQDDPVPRSVSPNGRFALKVTLPAGDSDQSEEAKLEIVERASGKVVGDLGAEYRTMLSNLKVVWSADSKRIAHRSGGVKQWTTVAYLWDGSAFHLAPLPEDLPSPDIKFRKSDEEGGVKNYGGGEEPLRWLKSGDLILQSEQTQMAHKSGSTYTATLTITISFDAQNHATVKSVSKSKTRVE